MNILVLGGTRFLGRGVVDAALAGGHEVTLFNRGQTNPGLYAQVETIHGDLTGDLDGLRGRSWDAAVDLDPTQLPRHTRTRAELLRGAVGHYVFVSTISVYLKVGSERAVQDAFGERAAVVRPGLIVGPHDPTDRFTYWVRRLAEGGDVLAPGDPARPVQMIDARDLGRWLVRVASERVAGVFNATGPAEPLTLGALLSRIGPDANLVWVDDPPLLDAGVQPWMELPLWLPGEGHAGMLRADISRALAAGLAFRPLEETARDTLAWSLEAGEQRPTLTREKEREILAGA